MNRKPRVLIDSFHLIQALTGIRTYTTQLLSGLEKLEQNDVEYLVYPNWSFLNKTNALRGKVNLFKKVLNHLLYFLWKQCCLPILILFRKIDVVVSLDYLLPYLKFGAKGVAVFHDTFYWEIQGAYNPLWKAYFLKLVEMGLNSQSKMIVTSNYIAEKVKRVITDQHDISVVYQSPKDLPEQVSSESIFSYLGLPERSSYFLHLGIFEKRKNLELLVTAFRNVIKNSGFEDFFLVLAGGKGVGVFHDDFAKTVQLIKDLDLEEKVVLPGFVPDDRLKPLYENAFAYVFPSKEEGFGIPVVEAMRAGVPVLISNQPALMEVAGEAALVFDMGSSASLCDTMLKLDNGQLRKQMIDRGRLRADMFTNRTFAEHFHSVIKETIKA